MRRLRPKADVLYQTTGGNDGEHGIRHFCVTPLNIPSTSRSCVQLRITFPAHPPFCMDGNDTWEITRALDLRPTVQFKTIVFPSPRPGSPTPDGPIPTEHVTRRALHRIINERAPADLPDALVIGVANQQLITKAKKRGIRQTIILDHRQMVRPGKRPIQTVGNPFCTAHVNLGIIPLEIARPIDSVVDQFSNGKTFGLIVRSGGAGAIGHNQQTWGTSSPNRLQRSGSAIRSIKDQKCDGTLGIIAHAGMQPVRFKQYRARSGRTPKGQPRRGKRQQLITSHPPNPGKQERTRNSRTKL